MHPSVINWIREKISQHHLSGDVLEVGSMDVNGSVRSLFTDTTRYVGVYFREGAGVDIVMNCHSLKFKDHEFSVVVSTEMIEHDEAFWLSIQEMGRVLKPGGHLMITSRGNGFGQHGYPDDYWRFMPSSFPSLIRLAGCEVIESIDDPEPGHPGLFAMGRKPDAESANGNSLSIPPNPS